MSSDPTSPTGPEVNPTPSARPLSVTLLAIGVLSITILGALRAYLAIRDWRFLASWPGVSPLYLAVTGALVAFIGALVFYGLASRKKWALKLTQAAVLTFALGYWLDQIFVADHPFSDPSGSATAFLPVNWPFAAVVTFLILLYTGWLVRNPKVKAYFGDENE
jgi:hypothetical protein